MKKFFLLIIIQLAFLSTLHAAQSAKEVKSNLLRAIHSNNTNTIRYISSSHQSVIKADPVLQKMVDAYFEDEARALAELKESARLKREQEARELAEAIAAKSAEEERLKKLEEEQKMRVAAEAAQEAKEHLKAVPVVKPEKKKVIKTVRVKKQVKKEVTAPLKKKTVLKTRPVKKVEKITMTHVDIAGQWKAAKRDKKVIFKAYANKRFRLEERSGQGVLVLEGQYEQEGEELVLEIRKITYNVRSREAAVQKIYQLKALSSKKMILLDETGEVAYTFKR